MNIAKTIYSYKKKDEKLERIASKHPEKFEGLVSNLIVRGYRKTLYALGEEPSIFENHISELIPDYLDVLFSIVLNNNDENIIREISHNLPRIINDKDMGYLIIKHFADNNSLILEDYLEEIRKEYPVIAKKVYEQMRERLAPRYE